MILLAREVAPGAVDGEIVPRADHDGVGDHDSDKAAAELEGHHRRVEGILDGEGFHRSNRPEDVIVFAVHPPQAAELARVHRDIEVNCGVKEDEGDEKVVANPGLTELVTEIERHSRRNAVSKEKKEKRARLEDTTAKTTEKTACPQNTYYWKPVTRKITSDS